MVWRTNFDRFLEDYATGCAIKAPLDASLPPVAAAPHATCVCMRVCVCVLYSVAEFQPQARRPPACAFMLAAPPRAAACGCASLRLALP